MLKFNSLSIATALAVACSTIALPAIAADYRSVSVAAAVLWDGPSDKAKRVFVAPRGMPVEVISVLNTWVKVKDYGGDVTWMAGNELSKTRTVVATTLATARVSAQDTGALAFQAERGVTLELLDAGQVTAGFARVKHKDGTIGFVKTAEVWGL
jgi:SH3-like domain-containing protein